MKQKEVVGTFFKVPIDEKTHTYGRILNDGMYAFYDFRTESDDPNINDIEKANILFKIAVHNSAFKRGGWSTVGIKDLSEDLKQPVPLFIQEIGNEKNCTIDIAGKRIKVSPKECIGIERFAVWEDDHVQQRLLDHYNNRPCKYIRGVNVKQ